MLTLTPLRFTAVLARSGGQPTVCPTVRTQQGARWRGRALSLLRGLKRRDRGLASLRPRPSTSIHIYVMNGRLYSMYVAWYVVSGWCWRSEAPQLERSLSLRRPSCTQYVPRLLPRAFRIFSVFVVFFLAYRKRFSRAPPPSQRGHRIAERLQQAQAAASSGSSDSGGGHRLCIQLVHRDDGHSRRAVGEYVPAGLEQQPPPSL